ncbi:hypothetical protein HZB01_04135 [Candidatus Woesearchaeota archaeon]|nr:hypothetical protein [Candidatus Woesearchaeota archaeon]
MTNWFLIGLGIGFLSFFASPYVAQVPFFSEYVAWVYGVVGIILIFIGFSGFNHHY